MESKQNQEETAMKLLCEAEENADAYRESLLEMSIENDQLYNDFNEMYDKIARISVRIDMVNGGLSSPEIAIEEISTILESIDK